MTLQSGLERFVSVPGGAVGWAGLTDTFAASWQVDWGWRSHDRFPRKSVTSLGRLGWLQTGCTSLLVLFHPPSPQGLSSSRNVAQASWLLRTARQ